MHDRPWCLGAEAGEGRQVGVVKQRTEAESKLSQRDSVDIKREGFRTCSMRRGDRVGYEMQQHANAERNHYGRHARSYAMLRVQRESLT